MSSCSRIRRHSLYFPQPVQQQRRLFNNISYLDILPLEVDLLIDELFDQLDLVDRVLTRQQQLQQQPPIAFGQRQRFGAFRQRPQQPQRPYRPRALTPRGGGRGVSPKRTISQQIRPKQQRKNVAGQRQQATATTSRGRTAAMTNLPFQQQPFQFQGRQAQQAQQLKQKKKPQQFGSLQQQQPKKKPFVGSGSVDVKSSKSMQQQQKYRICIDCRGCDCDPAKLKKSIKCGANGLYHLTCTAPCISCPTKTFKRSYTLPSQVQRAQMSCTTTSQGHCCIEFPLLGEQPAPLGIDLMPVQKIKTPEGKRAFFAQVPILPIMDPAKVQVCIQGGNRLIVQFEHKKTIDCCSRVKYCCQVPLPKKTNIDISSIACKQNKHTLNITVPVPVKQQTTVMTTTACRDICQIPVHRKLRHGKRTAAVGGGGVGVCVAGGGVNMPISRGQQQKPFAGIQQQQTAPIIKSGKPQPQQQQKKKPQATGIIENVMKPSATETTKQKKTPKKQHVGVRENILEGVSKGSELLEQVFGFGGKARPSTGGDKQQQKPTPTSKDKGVQQPSLSQVSGKPQSQGQGGGVNIESSSSLKSGDVTAKQSGDIEGSQEQTASVSNVRDQ